MVADSKPNSKTIIIDLINLLRGKEKREKVLAKVATNISHSSLQEQRRASIRWKIILPVIFGVALVTIIISFLLYIDSISHEPCSVQDMMILNTTKKGGPVDIAVNQKTNIVYAAYPDSKVILAIECNKQKIMEDPIPINGRVGELIIDPTTNRIYAVIPANNTISVIDSNTGLDFSDINEMFGELQRGEFDDILYDRPEHVISSQKTTEIPAALDVNASSGEIYVAGSQSNAIHTIDKTSAENPMLNNMKINDIALNSKTGKIYASYYSPNSSIIYVYEDGTINKNKNITGLGKSKLPNSLIVNPNTNEIYVINYALPKVSVIDGERDSLLKNTPVGTGPIDIAVDYSNNTVYVANQGSNTVSVIDGNKNQVVGILPIAVPSNNRLASIAVDSKTHLLYLGFVHDDGSGQISILNPATYNNNTYIQVSQSPIDMDFNVKTSELYVAEYNNNSVAVIDTRTDTLKRDIGLGNSTFPFNIAINPNSNKKYVANIIPDNNGSSIVSVISGKDDDILKNVSLPFRVSDLAIDPNSNKIYVTGGYKNYSYLSMIDGQNDIVMKTISIPYRPSDIAVNPNTNNIYLASNKDWSITVLEGKGDNILNNNSKISLSIPPESIVVDPDPATNRIYVTSYSKPTSSKQENSLDPITIAIPKLTQIQIINGSNNTVWWDGKTMKLDPKYGDILLNFNPKSHDLLGSSLSSDTIQSWNITQAQNAIQKPGGDGIVYDLKQVSAGIDYTQLAMNNNGDKLYIANPTLNAIKAENLSYIEPPKN